MQRYFFEISYHGGTFFGWQRQPKQISVQQVIENALTKLHSNREIAIVGCGRTDTGVHAMHYIFHADLPELIDPEQLQFKLNRMLPESIVVHKIYPVSDELHARFSATNRTYRYFINLNKNPFITETSWYLPAVPDFEKMNEATEYLLGTQDFTSLSKLHTDVKTNICTVKYAKWHCKDDENWYFEISADRFLRNMVRATVGTLLDVGNGKLRPEQLKTVLEAKDRGAASISVPAHGLFLWQIDYPEIE